VISNPSFARELRRGEETQVDILLQAAFGRPDEAQLVHKLRKAKIIAGETVLPLDNSIVGYYALSYIVQPKGWLCLAPVAVHPDLQRRGHGKRMMGILTEWARLTKTPVVVLGDPAFYTKTGFSQENAANLQSPYPVALVYPNAFEGL